MATSAPPYQEAAAASRITRQSQTDTLFTRAPSSRIHHKRKPPNAGNSAPKSIKQSRASSRQLSGGGDAR